MKVEIEHEEESTVIKVGDDVFRFEGTYADLIWMDIWEIVERVVSE